MQLSVSVSGPRIQPLIATAATSGWSKRNSRVQSGTWAQPASTGSSIVSTERSITSHSHAKHVALGTTNQLCGQKHVDDSSDARTVRCGCAKMNCSALSSG